VLSQHSGAGTPPLPPQLERSNAQLRTGRIGELKYDADEVLPLRPSEYFARNCWVGESFQSPGEAAAPHGIGVDKFMWGSDYPHHESTYPHTREGLRRSFAGTDPAELQQLLAGNAAGVYGFDLEALAEVAARVGPMVGELAEPYAGVPEGAGSPAFHRR